MFTPECELASLLSSTTTAGRESNLQLGFTLGRSTTPMLTPCSRKHTVLRAVHMAEDGVNIGVVSQPNVNPSYRFDFIPAVVVVMR